jgi:hypothetical protein
MGIQTECCVIQRTVYLLIVSAAFLAACGPGASDFDEEIGGTGYRLVKTDSRSYWVYPPDGCGPTCPGIPRHVDVLRWNERAIAVRRQVVNDFVCDEDALASEYLNRYEQYVIVLKTNTLIGPMDVGQFEQFHTNNAGLLDGIELLDDSSRVDGDGEVLQARGKCTNPKLLP